MTNESVAILKNEFRRRQDRNPNFSMRSFAKWLEVSPAQLSQVLSGKRPLSFRLAAKIGTRLGFAGQERIEFMEKASKALSHEKSISANQPLHRIKEDEFKLISEWYHFAILGLSSVPGAKSDPRWIARRLGISLNEAN